MLWLIEDLSLKTAWPVTRVNVESYFITRTARATTDSPRPILDSFLTARPCTFCFTYPPVQRLYTLQPRVETNLFFKLFDSKFVTIFAFVKMWYFREKSWFFNTIFFFPNIFEKIFYFHENVFRTLLCCPVLAACHILPLPFCVLKVTCQTDLSRQNFLGSPVLVVLAHMSILTVLSWLFYHGCPIIMSYYQLEYIFSEI